MLIDSLLEAAKAFKFKFPMGKIVVQEHVLICYRCKEDSCNTLQPAEAVIYTLNSHVHTAWNEDVHFDNEDDSTPRHDIGGEG